MKKRPHIIIFNPDEMRADALAHLGNPAAITPNLDAMIAKDAVSFSRAYCQNPVCVPSRCSFFTGLYPHVRGHRTMSYLLHPGEDSLLKELKESGYYVWMNDRNDLTAGQIKGWSESHADEIYYGGQKSYGLGPLNKKLRGEPGSKHYYSHYEGELLVSDDGKHYNADDEVVDAAINRILNPPDNRPMCLFLGLLYPHTPYGVEEPYFSAIDRKKLKKRVQPDSCCGKPKIEQLIREYSNMEDYSKGNWDELRAVYLAMCMKVDEQFGRLINSLKQAGIYDDCAIFFLSDHGDYTGDYGLVEKSQNSFEDCLTRVPFLIKPPKDRKVDYGISPALTELVDFYATVVDFAGITPNHTHFGRSLLPVLQDRMAPNREYVFCEGGRQPGEQHCDEYHSCGSNGAPKTMVYWPKMMAQTDDEAHAKGIMMRGERYKYVSRTLGNDEFYDMLQDPNETKNLIHKPEHQENIRKMQHDMLKWLQATADIVPFEYDQRLTPEMTWARVRAIVKPENEKKVKEMIDAGVSFGSLMSYCKELNEKE